MPRHEGLGFGLGALSLGAVVSAVAGTHKIIEALVELRKLHDVGKDNMIFVRIIDRVRVDLTETERLLAHKDVKYALSKSPEKVAWIHKTITAVREALQEMNGYTMRVRKDTDRGRWVGLRNRIYWRMEELEKLEVHSMEVARCHESLLQVLTFLGTLEPLPAVDQEQEKHRSGRHDTQQNDFRYKEERYIEPQYKETRFKEERYIEPRYEEREAVYEERPRRGGYEEERYVEQRKVGNFDGNFSQRIPVQRDTLSDIREGHFVERDMERTIEVEDPRYGRTLDREFDRRVEEERGPRGYRDSYEEDRYVERDYEARAEPRYREEIREERFVERDEEEPHHHVHKHVHKHVHRGHDGRREETEERYIDMDRRAEVRHRHPGHGHNERDEHVTISREEYRSDDGGRGFRLRSRI
ncbi:hypothetical protein BT63DRAFT_423390 [Microthyrium microscopicum]|uniref:Fungal N-terminal domain-containing protein n=1 Tax=Microthyrium microscopicum TaxID=703497 RepID=A0A6A6UI78_9PEZI|nr:hypothetical protein BT63DRAFT_423390 [Microthyrium microscopicum]